MWLLMLRIVSGSTLLSTWCRRLFRFGLIGANLLSIWSPGFAMNGNGKPITVAPTDATGRVLPPVIPNIGRRLGDTMEQFFPASINATRS